MSHLTADELIDAMEGILVPERQSHLTECAECQRQLADLSSVLNDAKQASVPEPSPLFWHHFSTRVNEAIDSEGLRAWPAWLHWKTLVPLGAMAMIVLALAFRMVTPSDVSLNLVDNRALEVELPADNWGTLTALDGELDIETASAAGVIEPGIADQAVLHLTADEQKELTRLLQAELTRAKS